MHQAAASPSPCLRLCGFTHFGYFTPTSDFSPVACSWGSPTLRHVPVLHSLLKHPAYAHNTTCASIHPRVDIWAVSIFRLLRIELLRTSVYKSLFEHLSLILGVFPGSRGNSMWRNRQTVSHKELQTSYILTSSVCGFNFFTSSPTLVMSRGADYGHPGGYEAVAHCGFDFHFPNDEW